MKISQPDEKNHVSDILKIILVLVKKIKFINSDFYKISWFSLNTLFYLFCHFNFQKVLHFKLFFLRTFFYIYTWNISTKTTFLFFFSFSIFIIITVVPAELLLDCNEGLHTFILLQKIFHAYNFNDVTLKKRGSMVKIILVAVFTMNDLHIIQRQTHRLFELIVIGIAQFSK